MQHKATGAILSPQAADREQGETDESDLDIELDDRVGLVRVNDARLFHPNRRAYARRLLKALCEHPGVRKAEIDLPSATCRVDFDLASNSPAVMAEVFVDAVRSVPMGQGGASWWRRRPRWSTLTGYRTAGDVSLWETHADASGRRVLHEGRVRDRATSSHMADDLASLDGVKKCHVSLWSRRISVVSNSSDAASASHFLDRVERILEAHQPADVVESDIVSDAASPAPIATGLTRLTYIALAGGAFTMTLVGLVVPGVPTVPFLLATSYYLARSSPSLNERLRRTVFFGPILREWEGHASLSLSSKGKLIALTATIVVVTVILAPLTPLVLIIIVVISSASVYGVTRIPSLTSDQPANSFAAIGTAVPVPVR